MLAEGGGGRGGGELSSPAPAPAPTLLYSKPTFWKRTKVNQRVRATLHSEFCMTEIIINMNGKSKKNTVIVCDIFINPPVCWNRSRRSSSGSTSRYGSGSTKMMQLLATPAPQHWYSIYKECLWSYPKLLPKLR
jgi:hypothetical protein